MTENSVSAAKREAVAAESGCAAAVAQAEAGFREGPAQDAAGDWPSPGRAWYAVFVFALSLMVNFLDRGILTLLVGPIKRDLHLSDVQMSLVMGFAFVCFYVLLGLPIARLVDAKSRRAIIGIGITVWSFMTALCGLAQSFWQLFSFRIGVGVGEACTGPATYSMLSDLFPKEKLPRAIAVLNFGFYAGTGIALIVGGTITQILSGLPPVTLPVIGTLHSWQLTFCVVGIPGLLVAALMWTVREPQRRGVLLTPATGRTAVAARSVPIREVLAFMRENAGTYVPMYLGMGLQTVLLFGGASWGPAFYMRTYGWTPAKYGLVQGLLALTIMPLGAFMGSLLAERYAKKGFDDANMRVVLLATLVALPGSILFPLMPNATLAVVVSTFALFCHSWNAAPLNAALQITTPNQMRGQMTALFLFVFNIIGFGLGPTFVAMFTDYVFHAESALRYSLVASTSLLGPLGVLIYWLGLKPYARSVARARTWG
jgi:MFS family permease